MNNTNPKPLAHKNALITGAARGIGQGIAIALAEAGANVVVNDLNAPDETIQLCSAAGVNAIAFQGDVSDRAAMEAAVATTVAQLGSIDILVSNAAFSDRELFYQASDAGFEKTINICMWGPFYLAKAAANAMIAAGNGGSLIFVSSPHAYLAIPGAMAYNMAKAAVDQLARTAAVELAEYGIRSNIIHPGWTDTPGERKFFTDQELATRGAALPLGRLAKPSDIARGAVFLADPASEYITGATISIDGGIVLPYGEMHRVKKA